MKVGVSTACLYPCETISALEQLLEGGVDHFEIFLNTISEIQSPYLKQISDLLSQFGADVKSIHPFTSGYEPYLLFTDYERRYRDTLEFYKNYFETAAYLGASVLVIHGDRKTPQTGGISDECYFEKFGELARLGREYGIIVAQENVNAFRSQKPDFIRKMKEFLGNEASFVFDIKQAVRSGADPHEMCSAMGERLVHVHINDNDPLHDCLLPGDGKMNYKKLFEIMKSNGYDGDFIIEVYRKNFQEISEIIKSYEYVKRLATDNFC